jgi:hypothetical protein
MTALLIERKTPVFNPDGPNFNRFDFPVKGASKIFAGAAVGLNAGYLQKMTAITGLIAVGIALATVDNTAGADGALVCPVQEGCYGYVNSGIAPVTQADVGNDVYFEDDNTISQTSQGATLSRAGKLFALIQDTSTGVTYAYVETLIGTGATSTNSTPTVGRQTLSIAGGAGTQATTSATLTAGIVELTGAITGNRILNITDLADGKQWTFANKTTGAFTVQVELAGANPITIAQGSRAILYADGTALRRVTADNP